ncbi:hypothetical protein A2T55_04775 [Brevibacterium linens]|uniref:RNA polymerase subunit sigma-24 n=1 Tax=Brevibacterium linens TaxID=1703 RepID=A0A142NLF0_BRELN|nr:RNA polymerase sigma factor SigJ [Brevibacterium linens]AMT93179.1 hypothetical protein A2T55_04775 [Brevibacterium linens]
MSNTSSTPLGSPSGRDSADDAETFSHLRPLLFSIAYDMLGSVADAEDVLQSSYMRWAQIDSSHVTSPKAYLVRTVSRQALNALRTATRRREEYIGTWLPEPLATGPGGNPADRVLRGEEVTMAMLVVLEALTPRQRAVFVLHDVFDRDYAEIAETLNMTQVAARQLAHRARSRIAAYELPDSNDIRKAQGISDEFFDSLLTGRTENLIKLLAPEVVYRADGGGRVAAARAPIIGAERVASLLHGIFARDRSGLQIEMQRAVHNGLPSLMISLDDELDLVMCIETRRDRINMIYVIRNPDKLQHLRSAGSL